MSIVINKLVGLLIFAAWFVVGTLFIKAVDRVAKQLKNQITLRLVQAKS
jgi:hypothetical protein